MDIVPMDHIRRKILLIRGRKVMLDRDLAEMYGVETRVLNQAVKRNVSRFPDDFMLQLTKDESEWLVSQNVIPHKKYLGGSLPNAFTENGVAMLSSVLNSERAIQVNISIMRTFTLLRETLSAHKELKRIIEGMEKKYDSQFKVVFDAIRQLMAPPEAKKKRVIGFGRGEDS
jgi:ORF6N domain